MKRAIAISLVTLFAGSASSQTITVGGSGTGSGVTFANPTSTVGPTPVNGSATTAMRSDAAPALASGAVAANLGFTPPSINGTPTAGDCVKWASTTQLGDAGAACGTSGMVYPGAGVPNSTGSAWGTSYSTLGSGSVILSAGTFTSTAGQNYTFPATSATLARTDSAQTFTGVQTFSGQITSSGNIGFAGARGMYVGGTTLLFENVTPSCAATGGSPTCTMTASNGSAAQEMTLGSAGSATSITITPGFTAAHGFVCDAFDATTTTERLKQTATTTTTATLTFYNDAGTATSPGASDVIWSKCLGL